MKLRCIRKKSTIINILFCLYLFANRPCLCHSTRLLPISHVGLEISVQLAATASPTSHFRVQSGKVGIFGGCRRYASNPFWCTLNQDWFGKLPIISQILSILSDKYRGVESKLRTDDVIVFAL